MSKLNLFKKITISAIAAAMCLSATLSASANSSGDFNESSAYTSATNAELANSCYSCLSDLQPYVDELQSINDEFGYDIEFRFSSEEEILWAHSEYCSMTIPEFRDYVIDLYNTSYVNYNVPELSNCVVELESIECSNGQDQATANSDITVYTATQRVYFSKSKPGNYF